MKKQMKLLLKTIERAQKDPEDSKLFQKNTVFSRRFCGILKSCHRTIDGKRLHCSYQAALYIER